MRRMFGFGIALAALSAIACSAALSADIPRQIMPTKGPVIVSVNWTGKYVGVYVGAEQGKSNTTVDGWTNSQTNPVMECKPDWKWEGEGEAPLVCKPYTQWHGYKTYQVTNTTNYPGVSTDGNVIGITGGMYAGYNQQVNSALVLGIEADIGVSGARDNEVVYDVTSSHKMPWNARLRGRVGFLPAANGNTMLYLALGGVMKGQKTSITSSSGSASESRTAAGGTAGVGVEHKWGALTGRVEAGYDKVKDQEVCIPGACTTLKGGSFFGRAGLALSF